MGKFRDTYWPTMDSREIAEKCTKNAANVAFFVAAMTAVLSLLAWFDVLELLSPLAIIDALLFGVIGFFIRRESRVAAVAGVILYLFEAADRLLSGGASGGASVVVIFFTVFMLNGVRATFYLAQLRKSPGATPTGA